jgi:hypothetical protein
MKSKKYRHRDCIDETYPPGFNTDGFGDALHLYFICKGSRKDQSRASSWSVVYWST